MGGECNYVLRVARPSMRLEFVPDEDWKSTAMMSWADAEIARLLTDAERVLAETAHRLRLPVQVSKPLVLGTRDWQQALFEVNGDLLNWENRGIIDV